MKKISLLFTILFINAVFCAIPEYRPLPHEIELLTKPIEEIVPKKELPEGNFSLEHKKLTLQIINER